MNTLTLSPKFQVVIPKHIREAMELKAGTPMQAVRGMLKGMDTDFEREDDRS